MNELQKLQQQIERERQLTIDGLNKHNRDITDQRQRCYFSGTTVGKKFRAKHIQTLREALLKSHKKVRTGRFVAERLETIRVFHEIVELLLPRTAQDEVKLELKKQEVDDDIFSILAHITLTAFLDASMAPYTGYKDAQGRTKNPSFRIKKTTSEVERFIGREFLFQVRLYLMSLVVEKLVEAYHKYGMNNGKASRYYHHYNVSQAVDNYIASSHITLAKFNSEKERCAKEGIDLDTTVWNESRIKKDFRTAQALELFNSIPTHAEKFLGDWARSVLMDKETKINAFVREPASIAVPKKDNVGRVIPNQYSVKMDQMFLPRTDLYLEWKQVYFDKEDLKQKEVMEHMFSYAIKMPMIVPPVSIKAHQLGGWLSESSTVVGKDNKGEIHPSDDHLDFYNGQASVPLRLNTWIQKLLSILYHEGSDIPPVQLGSFSPHHTIPPQDIFDLIPDYKRPDNFFDLEPDRQKADVIFQLGVIEGDKQWRNAVRERAIHWDKQADLVKEAFMSNVICSNAKSLQDLEEFYIPVKPDFRGRVVPRCFPINYQAPDHGKALLKFAEDCPVDSETAKWLLIQMANTIGGKVDKMSFESRMSEVSKRLKEVEAVARMLDEDGSFSLGMEVLLTVDGDDGKVFQFAAACREYYEIYLAPHHLRKKTTNLVVNVDASSSGQQIASVWLKSKELAVKTNVCNTADGIPSDLYGEVFLKMLSLMKSEQKSFTQSALASLEGGNYGRKLVKAGFQAGQYGAGKDTQAKGIIEKYEKLSKDGKLKFLTFENSDPRDELGMFIQYYHHAIEAVCQLAVLNCWFRDFAELVAENGQDFINVPTPNGSLIRIKYNPMKKRRTRTFSYGDTIEESKTLNIEEQTKGYTPKQQKERLENWMTSLLPNVTHAFDANLIAMALHDFDYPFTSCHDSLGCHASDRMNLMRKSLGEAMVNISQFDLFSELLKVNDIPSHLLPLPPKGEWDTVEQDIRDAKYLFS